jgi:hypothetical protein
VLVALSVGLLHGLHAAFAAVRKCEDMSVLVEREFCVDDLVEALARRGKILQPVACPSHRPTEVTGEHRDDDLRLRLVLPRIRSGI